jgi:membrane protein implicated in regulation of membrane protease activity
MLFNIPQFIDKEDKIVGPLTAKQLGWLAGAGVLLLILWSVLDMSALILAAIPILGIFGALAFYQPNGQPLISFIFSSISFFLHPKIYIWRRTPEKEAAHQKAAKVDIVKVRKDVDSGRIEEISKLLDQKQ